ncbi:MAG: hypothetical protein PV354_02195 [Bartonella sp.]|nr:hypothetical protein [Bartonella sp.]
MRNNPRVIKAYLGEDIL